MNVVLVSVGAGLPANGLIFLPLFNFSFGCRSFAGKPAPTVFQLAWSLGLHRRQLCRFGDIHRHDARHAWLVHGNTQ